MSRFQWLGLAVLAALCVFGGVNSPQYEEFLHPWRLIGAASGAM